MRNYVRGGWKRENAKERNTRRFEPRKESEIRETKGTKGAKRAVAGGEVRRRDAVNGFRKRIQRISLRRPVPSAAAPKAPGISETDSTDFVEAVVGGAEG